jgi:hypothetical protein
MPKTIITLLVIALVWIGYIVWPLYELALMVRAIDERDLPTVTRHVNFDQRSCIADRASCCCVHAQVRNQT